MAADTAYFRYSGAPARIVALDQDIEDGQYVLGPASLALSAGFTEVKKSDVAKGKLINPDQDAEEVAEAAKGPEPQAGGLE